MRRLESSRLISPAEGRLLITMRFELLKVDMHASFFPEIRIFKNPAVGTAVLHQHEKQNRWGLVVGFTEEVPPASVRGFNADSPVCYHFRSTKLRAQIPDFSIPRRIKIVLRCALYMHIRVEDSLDCLRRRVFNCDINCRPRVVKGHIKRGNSEIQKECTGSCSSNGCKKMRGLTFT